MLVHFDLCVGMVVTWSVRKCLGDAIDYSLPPGGVGMQQTKKNEYEFEVGFGVEFEFEFYFEVEF